ncbi:MAG: hypothetical protein Q8P05_03750 [Candidatus Diapherotrites archaeon]|nr:hypothetical protein [Candidatus Diapherotrites archaeon]MDZ4256662.1 hypothetical protein [archaeon]
MKKRTTAFKNTNHDLLSPGAILLRALGIATHIPLLTAQAMIIILTLLALAMFTVFMGVAALGTALVLGFPGVGAAAIGLALIIWVIGIIGINAFANGIQYHITMQTISKKPIDISLAWKLSSARVGDAFVLQSILLIFFLILLGLAFLPILVSLPSISTVLANPLQMGLMIGPLFLGLFAVLIILSPFLMLFLPIVFFEDAHPGEVIERARKYVKGNYWSILLVLAGLVFINIFVSMIADFFSGTMTLPFDKNQRVLLFVGVVILSFIVQAIATLYATTFSVVTQTLLYLKVGKPPEKVTFITRGAVSYALSRVAGDSKSTFSLPASSRTPKWKTPKRKTKSR